MNLPLTDNFIIEVSEKQPISHRGILDQKAIRNFSKKLVADYDIRCETLSQSASTLSGGNQQKLVFSRELSREPTFILAMQPSRGLDVGATEFVHEKLIEQRLNDCAVLLISTELDEIFELSDRISILRGTDNGDRASGKSDPRADWVVDDGEKQCRNGMILF